MNNITLKTLVKFDAPHVRGNSRDQVILQELLLPLKSKADPAMWELAWSDVLRTYTMTDLDWSLIPQHYKEPVYFARFCGEYVYVDNTLFVYQQWCALREHVFHKYLKDVPEVHEYGCGSGLNLLALARQLPGKNLVGYDLSQAAIATVKLIAERHPEISLREKRYSFIDGYLDRNPILAPMFRNHAVLTCGALEQVGKEWQPFLNLIMWQQPSICVHVEPLLELYDETILFDWLAARYHRSRGYLEGYLPAIQQLEKDGQAEIITAERVQFGNVHNEGFSLLVWRPK